MKFDIQNPGRWEVISTGEIIEMTGARKAHLKLNTTGRVSVYVAENEDMSGRKLVASHDGLFDVMWSAQGTTYVYFELDPGAVCFILPQSGTHVVARHGEEVYTTPEPRGRRNTEFDRMMMFMRFNEKRRDEQLQAAIAAMQPTPAPEEEPVIEEPVQEPSEPQEEDPSA